MKPINETLYAILVPMDAHSFTFYNKNTFRYQVGIIPTYINLEGFEWNAEILGTITRTECSFDCRSYIEDSEWYDKMWKNYNPIGKPSSRSNQCPRPIDSFKSLIESTTGYLFDDETKLLIIENK